MAGADGAAAPAGEVERVSRLCETLVVRYPDDRFAQVGRQNSHDFGENEGFRSPSNSIWPAMETPPLVVSTRPSTSSPVTVMGSQAEALAEAETSVASGYGTKKKGRQDQAPRQ